MSGRSIAPRPVPQSASTSSESASTSFDTSTGNAQPTATSTHTQSQTSARKKVTSACQGCQRRRVKCDGSQPCGMCQRTKSECSYIPQLDGRSIKRKYHEVQRDQELLKHLVDTIRYSSDECLRQIISLIRSGASIDDVRHCIAKQVLETGHDPQEQCPELKKFQADLDSLKPEASQDRPQPLHKANVLEISRLADTPLHRVPASPWTTVTDDDDLVSHLISSWLTWDKGWLEWIDEDLFVRDMQSGSLDALFCSPFLVNCLLAWGCPYSDFKEARTNNGAVSPLMLRFIEEARRLLEYESAHGLCMTTVQGLMYLHACSAVSGRDQSGYRWVLQAMGMTRDLMASPLAAKPHPDQQIARDISRVIDKTCWGVYISSTYTVTTILKPQTMVTPRRPRPRLAVGAAPCQWKPYAFWDESIPSYRDEIFEANCDFAIFEAELSQLLCDTEEQLSRIEQERRILGIYNNLRRVISQQPEGMQAMMGSCPSVFGYQARVQDLTLRLFLPLREAVESATPHVVLMARSKCIEASIETARICKLFMESWGASNIGIMMASAYVLSISVFRDEANTSQYFPEMTDLCVALRAMSRRWPLCMGMLRMIQVEARQLGKKLPPETDRLFEEFEGSAWKQREPKRYHTLYPQAETLKTSQLRGDEADMGKFLEQTEAFGLKD